MGLVAGLQPGDSREIGPYRILGRLGSGGMGNVFLGMSAGGRPIAVKVIREELADDPEFRVRFRREVAAARKVCGLFTAFVVDADLDGPMPWLATAYVPGPSLTEAVRDHGPLDAPTLLALAAGLAESLSAIHAAGVVHRDMKPSNVLLAEDGPRVIDFGISGAAEASAQTGASVLIGSPGFMSPEQVVGLEIGPPSDIFSLGAVLAFAGTGQAPFGVGSSAAILYRLVNSPPNLGQLPDEIRSLVGSCLAKHPSDRPTAHELLARVGAIQPAPGWLSEAIIYGSTEDQTAAGLATAGSVISAAALETAEPKSGIVARHARRRLPRAVTSAGITAGLVAASAAAVFALTGGAPQPLVPQTQSQTGGTAGSASHASLPPSPLASSHPAAPTPNAYLTPALSEFLTSSPPSRVLPTRSSAPTKSTSPSASPSGSASASPSPSVSESGSATPTPTPSDTGSVPSPSDSPTPSPSDSGSPSPSPSDSASPSDSPSPSDSASASPSDSSTATPSPTSS